MIVMKFGGTSVEDARAIRAVADIVRMHKQRGLLVVASACAGVTNALLALATGAAGRNRRDALDHVEQLRIRHRRIAHDLFTGEVLFTVQSQIDALVDELRDITRSIAILGEATDRSLDTFASFGERLSTLLIYHHFLLESIDSTLVSAQDVMLTDSEFTRAKPLFDKVTERAAALLLPILQRGQVVVTQGFLGVTEDGIPTTIGRGGSDYSASLLGAALHAEEIQIWTDVDGLMTCDPRIVSRARPVETMSHREAAELAYFGAKVLHPSTILPAVERNIPVRVLNSKRPQASGTVIVNDAAPGLPGVKALAFKSGITLITVESTRMLMTHGFLAAVFDVFAKYKKSVDVIATSEVSISLTVDSSDGLDRIVADLEHMAKVEVSPHKAILCLVGEGLKESSRILTRIFSTLDDHNIPVRMISLGASKVNVSFVVDESNVTRAAQSLHEEFFERVEPDGSTSATGG